MVVENHYTTLQEISPYHKKKIDELRSRAANDLAAYPEYNTDFSLLRWLLGYDYNIEAILPKLREAVITLTTLNLDQLEVATAAEINSHVRHMSKAAAYFPGGIMGHDDSGNVIYIQNMGQIQPKSICRAGSVSELFRMSIVETELSFKLVRKAEAKAGRKLGVMIVVDLDGFGMDLLYTPTLKIYKTLLQLVQDTFPDFARKIYVVNPPLMIKTVYALISPILSKQTKEKVYFLGNNWRDVLIQELGSHNIYPNWGGTKRCRSPSGDIRMGGRVPQELVYDPNDDPTDLVQLKVSAKSRSEMCIRAEKGDTIHWWWRVSSGDVDFWIERDGYYVWPKFRLSTEFYPEVGKLVCREGGDHILYFDNSHGAVWSKEVRCKVWIE